MPAKIIRLVPREREGREELATFAYSIQAEPQAVRIIVGTDEDGIELGLSPAAADLLAEDIRRAADHARRGRAGH
jgi:hypothetical protein